METDAAPPTNLPRFGLGREHLYPITYEADNSEYELFLEVRLRAQFLPQIVVKQFTLDMLYHRDEDLAQISQDLHKMMHLSPHPNLAPYLGFFCHQNQLHVVRSFAEGAPLVDLYESGFDTRVHLKIALQIANATRFLMKQLPRLPNGGMEFMEEPLSSRNYIYDQKTETVVLVDYQLQSLRGSVQMKWDQLNRASKGMLMYPPELMRTSFYAGEQSVVYNLAVISYQILMKRKLNVRRFHLKDIPDERFKAALQVNLHQEPDDRWETSQWIRFLRDYYHDIVPQECDDTELEKNINMCYDKQESLKLARNPPPVEEGQVEAEGDLIRPNAGGLMRPGDHGPMRFTKPPISFIEILERVRTRTMDGDYDLLGGKNPEEATDAQLGDAMTVAPTADTEETKANIDSPTEVIAGVEKMALDKLEQHTIPIEAANQPTSDGGETKPEPDPHEEQNVVDEPKKSETHDYADQRESDVLGQVDQAMSNQPNNVPEMRAGTSKCDQRDVNPREKHPLQPLTSDTKSTKSARISTPSPSPKKAEDTKPRSCKNPDAEAAVKLKSKEQSPNSVRGNNIGGVQSSRSPQISTYPTPPLQRPKSASATYNHTSIGTSSRTTPTKHPSQSSSNHIHTGIDAQKETKPMEGVMPIINNSRKSTSGSRLSKETDQTREPHHLYDGQTATSPTATSKITTGSIEMERPMLRKQEAVTKNEPKAGNPTIARRNSIGGVQSSRSPQTLTHPAAQGRQLTPGNHQHKRSSPTGSRPPKVE